MDIFNDFSLQKLNTFGLNVTAKHFVQLNSVEQIVELIKSKIFQVDEHLIIGDGSNLLFTKDFNGLVIKPDYAIPLRLQF